MAICIYVPDKVWGSSSTAHAYTSIPRTYAYTHAKKLKLVRFCIRSARDKYSARRYQIESSGNEKVARRGRKVARRDKRDWERFPIYRESRGARRERDEDKERMRDVYADRVGRVGVRQYGGRRHIAHSLRTQHILKCINPPIKLQ